MKQRHAPFALWTILAALVIVSLLGGCGAKGDLYRPAKTPKPASSPAPAPAPAPTTEPAPSQQNTN